MTASLLKNRSLAIATMHGKEKVIAPLLEHALGVKCFVPEHLNTDQFGTFTGEMKRHGNMLQAARAKAEKAIELIGCDLVLASEGSFAGDPDFPFLQSNLELIFLIDTKNNLELHGSYRTYEPHFHGQYVRSTEEGLRIAHEWDFPNHGVIVRFRKNLNWFLFKEIENENELKKTLKALFRFPFVSRVYIEVDLRAHKNPTRMKAIEQATQNLIEVIASSCPKCKMPGFRVMHLEGKIPCQACGLPSEFPAREVYVCHSCSYQKKIEIKKYGEKIEWNHCSHCNP